MTSHAFGFKFNFGMGKKVNICNPSGIFSRVQVMKEQEIY